MIITNLTARPYFVSDQVYGYNAKGQRVSDGNDDFAMAGHESVNRVVYLDSHVSQGFGREDYGRAFVVVMSLKSSDLKFGWTRHSVHGCNRLRRRVR